MTSDAMRIRSLRERLGPGPGGVDGEPRSTKYERLRKVGEGPGEEREGPTRKIKEGRKEEGRRKGDRSGQGRGSVIGTGPRKTARKKNLSQTDFPEPLDGRTTTEGSPRPAVSPIRLSRPWC